MTFYTYNSQHSLPFKTFSITSAQVIGMDKARFLAIPLGTIIRFVTDRPFNSIIPGGNQRYIVSAVERHFS